jgi:phosphotransferase system, enzyme I, PtsP
MDGNQRSRDPVLENKRLDGALRSSLNELATHLRVPDADAGNSDGRRQILEDAEFVNRIRERIGTGYTAERALISVVEELHSAMQYVADDHLRERAGDFRDLGRQVLRHLAREPKNRN